MEHTQLLEHGERLRRAHGTLCVGNDSMTQRLTRENGRGAAECGGHAHRAQEELVLKAHVGQSGLHGLTNKGCELLAGTACTSGRMYAVPQPRAPHSDLNVLPCSSTLTPLLLSLSRQQAGQS